MDYRPRSSPGRRRERERGKGLRSATGYPAGMSVFVGRTLAQAASPSAHHVLRLPRGVSIYSVQQLLFDSMSYIEEYRQTDASWHVAVMGADLGERELAYDVWLHRPALSQRAAETVAARLQNRFGVQPIPDAPVAGRFLFLGLVQAQASRPSETGS